ncbi:MAG: (2Fe-2S)-binding protein [Acholeplasmatales bacterium]|jgi:bacterioferritin-associated ferredoxin|nr:(2Fe-2S)-binding protein [Acholeplasmataceae bacterium]MDY0115032.1 (2Fe-2S)-binding protein [Acholeplasmatales bacterium]MCK9234377.1 (2Fe-2S)-binding protein [Acholeplasmataceae bacterium]MCK9289384.1 (2Fe-2S)-binding protein [Acholeplasmataceae bacterium]MCK9428096.1 (2Fe-2S)-binding protein [Acholeplasmataceae bacterium]
MNDDKIIICRCEDVTLKDIKDLLQQGYTNFEDLKRLLRVGMGACQGNTCGQLIQREIAKFLNKSIEEIPLQKVRPLISGVPLEKISEASKDES